MKTSNFYEEKRKKKKVWENKGRHTRQPVLQVLYPYPYPRPNLWIPIPMTHGYRGPPTTPQNA